MRGLLPRRQQGRLSPETEPAGTVTLDFRLLNGDRKSVWQPKLRYGTSKCPGPTHLTQP